MIAQQHSQTILCSAGKGEMFKDDCIACALAGTNYCGMDAVLLKGLLDNKDRTGIHVTDLTGCLKKSWYDKTTTMPEYPHAMMYRFQGTIAHGMLEDYGGENAEMPVEAFGITGTCDLFRDGKIVDWKTARWLTPSKLPYGSHELQVNIYAAMLRELGKEVKSAAIQYIDMSGPTKCKFDKSVYVPDAGGNLHCPKCERTNPEAHTGAVLIDIPLRPHDEMVAFITERRDVLLKALENGTMPDAEPSFLCEYCQFFDICNP